MALRQLLRAAGGPVRWWNGLEANERVLYRAVVLLGIGCFWLFPPAGFIVPGAVFALVFFGFSLQRKAG